MNTKFSNRMNDVFNYAKEEALRLETDTIGTEHLMLGIIRDGEGTAVTVLKSLGLKINDLRKMIENAIISLSQKSSKKVSKNRIELKKQTEKALRKSIMERRKLKADEIKTIHVLLSILLDNNNVVTSTLKNLEIDYDIVLDEYLELYNDVLFELESPLEDDDDIFEQRDQEKKETTGSKSSTPVLDNFGRDLTKAAERGTLDPIVGRRKEIERVSQILSRRKKNNPILIGEPGVGKSAIAEGLALRIVNRKISMKESIDNAHLRTTIIIMN